VSSTLPQQTPLSPPVIRVNRRACRPHPPPRASRVSCHPPQVSGLTFAHPLLTQPHSPSPTAVRSTNRVTLRGSIFGPLASAAKMGSHDGVVPWLHCIQRQVGSKYNSELGSPTFIFSFLNLSRRLPSSAVVHPPDFFFFFKSYASFSPFARPGAVPVTLSLLPLLSRSSLS
jgi:hypothetical protein